jgi:PAS domain S-box-containing protein
MSEPSVDHYRALEKKLADIEGENEILIERAEDILLLGLVTEAISRQIEPEEIMATVLERVSILKDVPYCALVKLDGVSLNLEQEYTVFRETLRHESTFEMPRSMVDELQQGATLFPDTDVAVMWTALGFSADDPAPESAMLVPFITTYHDRAALLLVDTQRRPEVLASLLPLLEQVIHAATARIENASLFQELEELTESLDRLVRKRTAALREANKELEKEAEERRRAEEESQLAATFFECAREGIIITSPDTTILTVNRAFCAITGYAKEEIVGLTPSILASGRHDPQFYAEMWATIEKTGGWRGEIWNRRKTGEVYPEALSITAVRNEDDELTHYVGLFSELSDRTA